MVSHREAKKLCLVLAAFCFAAAPAFAQTSNQQYVYLSTPSGSGSLLSTIAGFSIDGQTGALTLLSGSPFPERLEGGLAAIDGQGRFLFVLNPSSDNISMFQINPTSGALSEVPGSPFAYRPLGMNAPPSNPLSIATDRAGRFVFIGYLYCDGDTQGPSCVVSLSIDTSGSSPVLSLDAFTLTASSGAPIQLLTDSKGTHLYVGLGLGSGVDVAGAEVYSVDPQGSFYYQGTTPTPQNYGLDYAIDPQDRFLFMLGGISLTVVSCIISPVDGTASTCGPPFLLDSSSDQPMVVESSGHFMYIPDDACPPCTGGVAIYSIDQTSGALTQVGFAAASFSGGTAAADPLGPYIYSVQPTAIHVYQVDRQTGNLTEIPGSPFSALAASACCLAISGLPAQAIAGPALGFFPSSLTTFTAVVGNGTETQGVQIFNIGNQNLAIDSISLAGSDPSSFSQTNTCPALLTPNASCSVTITFTPMSAGTLAANLEVADNAPGSPQGLALSGVGIAPAPSVTFSPPAPSFPPTAPGASSSQTLTLLSGGNAPLHVSSVALTGPNPSDFSFTNNCTVPVAPGASCNISLIFNPTAIGQRSANLVISDDSVSPASPQTIPLSATGVAPVHAITFSPTSLSFSPPSVTQGTANDSEILTVTNSGNVPLNISSISITGPDASDFLTPNTCVPFGGGPSSSCAMTVVFSPVAVGQRTATLVFVDDAANSPQSVSLSGTAVPAFSAGAAPGGSITASVSAGQTAQYQLQLAPGIGFTGTVAVTCSGAPQNATCLAPPTGVPVANANPVPFTVTVTTSGPALGPPSTLTRFKQIPSAPVLALFTWIWLAWLCIRQRDGNYSTLRARLVLAGALSVALCYFLLGAAGCGGGAAVAPPPVVTPPGTSTLMVSFTATSPSGQPLQLQPLQLTLMVK